MVVMLRGPINGWRAPGLVWGRARGSAGHQVRRERGHLMYWHGVLPTRGPGEPKGWHWSHICLTQGQVGW